MIRTAFCLFSATFNPANDAKIRSSRSLADYLLVRVTKNWGFYNPLSLPPFEKPETRLSGKRPKFVFASFYRAR